VRLTSIDLFCGAGGLSLGLERAGFQPVLGLDINSDACATYRQAFPKAKVLQGSVVEVNFKKWRGIDLIAGGPPCQPFSNGGKRLAAADTRDMLPEFVRAVNEALPRAFIMENVAGLLAPRNRDYLNKVLGMFKSQYTVLPPRLVNSADYGVPQKRMRVMVIGILRGSVDFPLPTHRPGRYVSSGSVLCRGRVLGVPNPSNVVFAKSPDLRQSPYAGQLFNGGGRALNLEQPAPTILASAGGNKTHFIDELALVPAYHRHLMNGGKPKVGALKGGRRLTVLESALLQTFPGEMEFEGSRSSQYAQIGNAVPPRLAEIVGASIANALH
jgi:DNA (cytosine-5)-methyltransferase 1